MKRVVRWTMASLLAVCVLAGCKEPKPQPVALTKEQVILRDAPPERVFNGMLGGESVHLVTDNCVVYLIKDDGAWEKVLEPEFYPSFMTCHHQSLQGDGDTLIAALGRVALGAGGCCSSGGTYRTTDGRNWKKF